MRGATLILILNAVAIAGYSQSAAQDQPARLKPYQERALENAISRKDISHSGFLNPLRHPLTVLNSSSVSRATRACAVPLLPVPIDPDLDNRIRHEIAPEALNADSMPKYKGLPVCLLDGIAIP